jgi:hypothetical protein
VPVHNLQNRCVTSVPKEEKDVSLRPGKKTNGSTVRPKTIRKNHYKLHMSKSILSVTKGTG